MYVKYLELSEFRNYRRLALALEPGFFVFHGDNAQGKTNLLEAVSMLAMASSFHASNDREVVNWFVPEHVAHIDGVVSRHEGEVQIQISIFDPTPPIFANHQQTNSQSYKIEIPANAPRKRYKINGAAKKTMDAIGQSRVVLFAPTDLHIVDGTPDERRRFLDRALCQIQPRYCQVLMTYRKIVAQRAALLKHIRDQQEDPQMLRYLDEQLTKLASQLIYQRQNMISILNQHGNIFQQTISGNREQLQIVYRPSFKIDPAWSLTEAAQQYLEQLHIARKKEIQQGMCLLGPHRDDLEFLVNDINMLTYGSRGQQRTVALATKLAELAFMRLNTGDEPILLLDDVFSELDHQRRDYLLSQVMSYDQVFLTTTDLDAFPAEIRKQAHTYHVISGTLTKET